MGSLDVVLASMLLLLPVAAQVVEYPLTDFDIEGARGSYVLSVPPDHDPAGDSALILDLHGAIHPSRKGATVTRNRLWSKVVERIPVIVAGPNGRKRAWGMVRGERDDRAYVHAVLADVRRRYRIDSARVYLSGFSSGSDFLCTAGLQRDGVFAASLVTCPGPPNVVGLRGGELAAVAHHPFCFVAGEEDYIRKDGAWQAFLEVERKGGRAIYREVPGVDHDFFPVEEYERLFRSLEILAGRRKVEPGAEAEAAMARKDWLAASGWAAKVAETEREALLAQIEQAGKVAVQRAEAVDPRKEAGRAYEAWWAVATRFHRLPEIAKRGRKELEAIEGATGRRALMQSRREWFRLRTAEQADRDQGALWSFDRYLDYAGITEHVHDLARRYPERMRLESLGRSIEGRELWCLEVTDRRASGPEDKLAVGVQGGIHGNKIGSTMVALYFAWQLAANPDGRRTSERLRREKTLYVAPCINPDAAHRFITEPNSASRCGGGARRNYSASPCVDKRCGSAEYVHGTGFAKAGGGHRDCGNRGWIAGSGSPSENTWNQ